MLRYHVTFNNSKRIIQCEDVSLVAKAIKKEFLITSDFKLQVFQDDFNDYIDIAHVNELPSKGKLLVKVPSSDIEVKNEDAQRLIVKSEPDKLAIPELPANMIFKLDNLQRSNLPLTTEVRNEIINYIFSVMVKHTSSPSPMYYKEVCHTITDKFPILKDQDRYLDKTGCRYHAFFYSLREKFKNYRTEVGKNIFTTKETRKRKLPVDPCLEYQENKNKMEVENISEDDCGIKLHLKALQAEMKKKHPKKSIIKDLMHRTFEYRRKLIHNSCEIEVVTKSFPPLKFSSWIISEFGNLCPDKNNRMIKTTQLNGLVKWNKVPENIQDLLDNFAASTLIATPTIFKEEYESFIIVDKIPVTPYPTLVFETKTKNISLYIEGQRIEDISDFNVGIKTLIASYWVFNLNIPTAINKTIMFLAAGMYGVKGLEMPISVKKLFGF